MARLFDLHVIVDWSASATPARGKDSIWIAVHGADGGVRAENVATRREAEARLAALFGEVAATGQRVLAGFDFPFGYPAGSAAAMAAAGAPADWRGVWTRLADEIAEGPRNANNRFAVAAQLNRALAAPHGGGPGPFWGCPARAEGPALTMRKPPLLRDGVIPERRAADGAVRAVSSCWQLFYNGSVGGQALTGIATLERLRRRAELAPHMRVWPFETGLAAPAEGAVVLAEVYPSLIAATVAAGRHEGEVKDRAQVRLMARAMAMLDRAGRLGALFEGPPGGLGSAEAARVVAEEAWILGAGHAGAVAEAALA